MPHQDIVVIGASAGGVEAISRVVAELPPDLRAAVFVVLHVARGRSVLPEILTRAGRLPAAHPTDGEPIQYGRIYVAPPDSHMVVDPGTIRLVHGPTENGVRPAVDPLFRSAARSYSGRVVGIVLTGALDDGTAGLAAVKEAGGVAVVQDPEDASAPSMPRSAMEAVEVDHVLPLAEIPALIVALAREESKERQPTGAGVLSPLETDLGRPAPLALFPSDRPGHVSVLTCPECDGTLWELEESGVLRFRCRIGHAYTIDSMLSAQADSVDRALWAAVRSLEERAALTRRLAERARARNHTWVADAFEARADTAQEQAVIVRGVIMNRAPTPAVPDHAAAPATPETPPAPEAAKETD